MYSHQNCSGTLTFTLVLLLPQLSSHQKRPRAFKLLQTRWWFTLPTLPTTPALPGHNSRTSSDWLIQSSYSHLIGCPDVTCWWLRIGAKYKSILNFPSKGQIRCNVQGWSSHVLTFSQNQILTSVMSIYNTFQSLLIVLGFYLN